MSTPPRNVLHLLAQAQLQGSAFARIVASLATHLDAGRYRTHAWFLSGDGPLASELRKAGVKVSALQWTNGVRNPLGALLFLQKLRQRGAGFSIVHDHIAGRAARLLVRATTRAKILLQIHALADSEGRLMRYSSLATDAVLAVSHAAAKTIKTRTRVIYPGVALRAESLMFRPPDSRRVIVGTAGFAVPVKGFTHLLRAFGLLRSELPRIELEIAGDGPLRRSLEQEARALGIQHRVSFIGWLPNLDAAVRRWDIYVQPSLIEGFGMATVDAMAGGLPVVATSGSGLAEIVVDGVTGWLVPPADPAALADRIKRLALRPEERLAFGRMGRERAEKHFSEKRMVAEIQQLYDELLSPPDGTAGLKTREQASGGEPSGIIGAKRRGRVEEERPKNRAP